MTEQQILCPIRYKGAAECIKDRCAWWNSQYKKCAVYVIAIELGTV